jgi:hypothetical protein
MDASRRDDGSGTAGPPLMWMIPLASSVCNVIGMPIASYTDVPYETKEI